MPHRPVNSKIRNIIGPNVQKERLARGWTQADLARECQLAGWNIDKTAVFRIEARKRTLLDYETFKLSQILGVPVDALRPAQVDWGEIFSGYLEERVEPELH